MNFLRERLRGGSPGQTVIFFALMMTLIASFMAIVIDVGLLVNERRDVQNDVDKAALAGALALTLDPTSTGEADAISEAEAWLTKNGVDLTDIEVVVTRNVVSSCFSAADPVPTGVYVQVVRPAPSFLIGLLGITDWNASAEATACAGRAQELNRFMPWAVSQVDPGCFLAPGDPGNPGATYLPRFGEICEIVLDTNSNGLHGELGLSRTDLADCDDGNGSANVLEMNIVYGATSFCDAGDLVANDYVKGNPGHNVGKAKSAIEERLSTEGACDAGAGAGLYAASSDTDPFGLPFSFDDPAGGPWADRPGIDDFFEVYRWTERTLTDPNHLQGMSKAGCSSPRDITVIVVRDWANPENGAGNNTYQVRAFLQMYVEECVDKNGNVHVDCDWNGGGKFTIRARMVDVLPDINAGAGIDVSFGRQLVFLKD